MKEFGCKWLGLVASAVLLCSTARAQNGGLRFTLTDLGTRFKASWSEARAINNRGQVVGSLFRDPDWLCFSWQPGGTPQEFGGGTQPQRCDAFAVDSDGTIAGMILVPKTGPHPDAFRRDSSTGNITILPSQCAGCDSTGLGILKQTVVGFSAGGAVQWDYTGKITALSPSAGYATGINSYGQIVGFDAGGAFTWQKGSLTHLPQLRNDSAYAINNNGVAVGASMGPYDFDCISLWYGGAGTNIGCLPPEDIVGVGISSDNWVVTGREPMYSSFYSFPPCDCGYLIVPDPSCSPTLLGTLLDSSGAGWTRVLATGINDSHQIVGMGLNSRGETRAILLTPNGLPLCHPA